MGQFAFAYVMMQADWRASVALLVLLLAPPTPQLSITQLSACLKERYRE
jgi:hypothetical protein